MDFADLVNQFDGIQIKENLRLKRMYNRLVREAKEKCPGCEEPKKPVKECGTSCGTEEPKTDKPTKTDVALEEVAKDFFFEAEGCGEGEETPTEEPKEEPAPVEEPAPTEEPPKEEPAPVEEPKEEPAPAPAPEKKENGLTKEEFFNIKEQEAVTGEQKRMKDEEDTFGAEGEKEDGGKTEDPPEPVAQPEKKTDLPPPAPEAPVEEPAPEKPVDENDPTQAHNAHGVENQLREGEPVEQPDLKSFFGSEEQPTEPAPENPAPAEEPAPEAPKEELAPTEEPAPEAPTEPTEPVPEKPVDENDPTQAHNAHGVENQLREGETVDENDPTQAHNAHGVDNQLREDGLSDDEIKAYINGLQEKEEDPLLDPPEDGGQDPDAVFNEELKEMVAARPEFFQ